jgi:hypothetical protein
MGREGEECVSETAFIHRNSGANKTMSSMTVHFSLTESSVFSFNRIFVVEAEAASRGIIKNTAEHSVKVQVPTMGYANTEFGSLGEREVAQNHQDQAALILR